MQSQPSLASQPSNETAPTHHLTRHTTASISGVLKFRSLMKLRLHARRHMRKDSISSSHIMSTSETSLLTSGNSYGAIGSDEDVNLEEEPQSELSALKDVFLGSYLNLLLLIVPVALCSEIFGFSKPVVFALNFCAILPLAQMLGEFTEEIALHTNDVIGGLLNATLGNATEVIISIFALKSGLLRVVQVSLLGSVLSNQLLVTGCCFFFGGLANSEQSFNSRIASIDSSLLLMAVLGLTIPAAFSTSVKTDCVVSCKVPFIVDLSHYTAILLFFLYFALMLFQLKTHKHLMDPAHSTSGQDPEEEKPKLSMKVSIVMLAVITVSVAVCSELLVGSIEDASAAWGLSQVFIGLILLPIIGNAAEHATAITVAVKGKMDLALSVALGSSVQIALCVVPVLCLSGWALGKPLTLDFHIFETVVLITSVLVVSSVIREGSSTWLEGTMLITSYLIIALAYYYRHDPEEVEYSCVCGEACCRRT